MRNGVFRFRRNATSLGGAAVSRRNSGRNAAGRTAGIYLLANALYASIPFFLLPLLTRYLEPRQYGQVAMFHVLLGAVGAFVGLTVDGAASRKYFDEDLGPADMQRFIGACLQIVLLTAAIALCLVSVFGNRLSGLLDMPVAWLLWTVVACAGTVVVQLRLGQWMVRRQAWAFSALQMGQALLNAAISIVLVVGLHWGAEGRIAGQVVSVVLASALAVYLLARDRLLSFFSWEPRYWREALRFGVPLVPHIAGIYLLSTFDRMVVNTRLGLSEAGIYLVAVQLSSAVTLVFDAVNKAYVPWLFGMLGRNDVVENRRIVSLTYRWYAAIAAGVVAAFLLGPLLVPFVVGERYAAATQLFGWLCLGQGLAGMYLMVTNYVFYSKRTGELSLVTITAGVMHIGLVFLMTGQLGLMGAALAFCLSMAFRFGMTWWVANRRHPMPWFSFIGQGTKDAV